MYSFKYRLSQAPAPTLDGSGMVIHDITVLASPNEDWETVPGRHKTVLIPGSDLQTVMDMPDSTGTQRQAKNAAYKELLRSNLSTSGVPITGWSESAMDELMTVNDATESVALEANEYITVTLSQSYPVDFNL